MSERIIETVDLAEGEPELIEDNDEWITDLEKSMSISLAQTYLSGLLGWSTACKELPNESGEALQGQADAARAELETIRGKEAAVRARLEMAKEDLATLDDKMADLILKAKPPTAADATNSAYLARAIEVLTAELETFPPMREDPERRLSEAENLGEQTREVHSEQKAAIGAILGMGVIEIGLTLLYQTKGIRADLPLSNEVLEGFVRPNAYLYYPGADVPHATHEPTTAVVRGRAVKRLTANLPINDITWPLRNAVAAVRRQINAADQMNGGNGNDQER